MIRPKVKKVITKKKKVSKKKQTKPVKKIRSKPKKKAKSNHKKQLKKSSKKTKRTSQKKENPAKKNRFLNTLRAKTQSNKTYPRIAQRRAMQGRIHVRYTILPSGSVSNIKITGPRVFHKSARNAVKKSFPISVKNVPFKLPLEVNVRLDYLLR